MKLTEKQIMNGLRLSLLAVVLLICLGSYLNRVKMTAHTVVEAKPVVRYAECGQGYHEVWRFMNGNMEQLNKIDLIDLKTMHRMYAEFDEPSPKFPKGSIVLVCAKVQP